MTSDDGTAEMFAQFIHLYSEQNESNIAALLQAFEVINDSIQKGFSDVEEQLENIGDALRDLNEAESDNGT